MISTSAIIQAAVREKRTALLEHEAKELARAVGIPVPDFQIVKPNDSKELLAAADALGYPLALKAMSADILHKTEAGAVALDITDSAHLESAVGNMMDTISSRLPKANIRAFLLERMMQPGLELLVGGLRDEQFGPSIAFGLGGIWVETLNDAVFGILPVSREELLGLISETRAGMLLKGFRGSPPLDQEAVLSIINAVSSLMTDTPGIREIDVNPLRVYTQGAAALDVRVILG